MTRHQQRLVWLAIGVIVGSLLSSPVSAQVATRVFASLTADLPIGRSTPVLCTANGNGCFLSVQVH